MTLPLRTNQEVATPKDNSKKLLAVINKEPSKTSRELGQEFNVSHTKLGNVSKLENGFYMILLNVPINSKLCNIEKMMPCVSIKTIFCAKVQNKLEKEL